MICRQRRLVFVHIPKCGGTSVEDVLWPKDSRREDDLWMGFIKGPLRQLPYNRYQTGGLQHLKAHQIRHHMGRAAFGACKRFTLVRDPYKRVLSQANYMRSRKDLLDFVGVKHIDDLDAYFEAIARRSHVQWERQVSFIYDYNGDCLVDRVFKLESIDDEAAEMFSWLGVEGHVRLPHTNKAKRTFSDADLEPRHLDIIHDLYAEDFDLLDYPRR